jgi:hypothetical protein
MKINLSKIIYILVFSIILLISGLIIFSIYKVLNPQIPERIVESYSKIVTVDSFDPPKHVYINFKFEDGKIKQYYISKHCSVNKIKKAIQEKTQYTLHFDVYEEVEYDGKIDRTTRMKESLYALFCQ